MSRYPQDFDPNAAAYYGQDPAAAQTFARLAQLIRGLQHPPLVRVISKRAYPGFYTGYEIDGALPVDGSVAPPDPYYGGQLNQRPVCVINPADFGSGAWSIPIPRTLLGARRQGLDGETAIVVQYFGDAGDPNGAGVPPGDTGPGSSGSGGGPGGACPLTRTVTIAGVSGTGHDAYFNKAWTFTWNGDRWQFTEPLPWDVVESIDLLLEVNGSDPDSGLPTGYDVSGGTTLGWTLLANKSPADSSGCPPLGLYTTDPAQTTNGGTVTVS